MNGKCPTSTLDLHPSERRFTVAMQQLGFGRFESVKIQNGELLLDPWPVTVRSVTLRQQEPRGTEVRPRDFVLKQQVIHLFQQIRRIRAGEIRRLEVQAGLPFRMEITETPAKDVTC